MRLCLYFIQGGTGIVFSKQLLKQLAPKLSVCLNNLLTEHEDVEIGRCVQKMTGVQCTTSWETAEIFYQDFKTDTGYLKHLEKSTVGRYWKSEKIVASCYANLV